jgi:CheY-like chemotaxis protein
MQFLVVDPNVSFATLLSDELENLGHNGHITTDGQTALAAAEANHPDMAFLDMGLGASKVARLGQALRSIDAAMRLVIIPLNGESLPEDVKALSVQGVLPKPFFLPELPERIAQVLSTPMGENEEILAEALTSSNPNSVEEIEISRVKAPETRDLTHVLELESSGQPHFSSDAFNANHERIQNLMENLAMDVGADGVILTQGNTLITWTGRFSEAEANALARVVVQGWKSSAEVARILGQEQLRFEQSIAGGSYLLYAVSVLDAILAVPVKGAALLGLLRQNARRVAKQIAALCLD